MLPRGGRANRGDGGRGGGRGRGGRGNRGNDGQGGRGGGGRGNRGDGGRGNRGGGGRGNRGDGGRGNRGGIAIRGNRGGIGVRGNRGDGGRGARGQGVAVQARRGWAAAAPDPIADAQFAVRGAPPRDDQDFWQQFRDTVKQQSCNYFEYHRRGLSRNPQAIRPWDDPNRPPLFREPADPQWDGRYQVDARAAIAAQRAARAGFDQLAGGSNDWGGRPGIDPQATAGAIRDRLAQLGVRVRLIKLLGVGGNGVATLFEVWPGGDEHGPSKKVVVKSVLKAGRDMSGERSYNFFLKRAGHIVQPLAWSREIIPTAGLGDAALQALRDRWAPIDDDQAMLTSEFMKNGDMHHLIQKLAKESRSVPQAVLWRIFFCLVRGCIAMYSPPRTLTRLADGRLVPAQQVGAQFGPDIDEELAQPDPGSNRPPPGWNFIHFDLDPQNVLIGDTDSGQHTVAPIFKIGDLGLGRAVDDDIFEYPEGIWGWRRMGKVYQLLPEQYHKEWDYIRTVPALERHRVAGRYGEWSNIFQMGLCIQSLITKALPPYPPQAIGPLNSTTGLPNPLFDNNPTAIIRDSSGTPVATFYTHGFNLVAESGGLDEAFLHLLLRCLADLPADRPPLAELESLMRRMEGTGGGMVVTGEDLGASRAWCDWAFGEPVAPPASAEEASPALASGTAQQQPLGMFAEAASASAQGQHGAGNDRPPLYTAPPRPPGGDGGGGSGGASFVFSGANVPLRGPGSAPATGPRPTPSWGV